MSKRKPNRVPPLFRNRDGVPVDVVQEWQMVRHSTYEALAEFAPYVDPVAFEKRMYQHFVKHTERLANYAEKLKADADA